MNADVRICKIRDGPQIRRALTVKAISEMLQILYWSRRPEILVLFDHDLEQNVKDTLVNTYVELCDILGHELQSLEWGIIEEDRFVSRKELKERAKVLSKIKGGLK